MKNLYLNFCKLATLVLMLGLSFRFLSVQNTIKVWAQATTSYCLDGETIAVPANEKRDFEEENPTATEGACEEEERKVTICHAAGQEGTTHFNTLTIGYNAVYGPAGHFYENGTPRAGHEDDYLGECESDDEDEEEEESTVPSMSSQVSCGQIDMTFNNPTAWFFSFDYRVDNEAGHDDAYTNMAIANGPFAGTLFGQRYNEVSVAAGTSQNRTVSFIEDSGTHTVSYRLFRGAENDLYLNWVSREVSSDCMEPESTPAPTPTSSEPAGHNCPVAQSCSNACGQSARDIPNGSCGFKHCDPTPSCDGGIGGGSQGQVLGASTMSGKVLGASTYAATGIVEDTIFSLVGVAGAGLSGAGILLKRDAKSKK